MFCVHNCSSYRIHIRKHNIIYRAGYRTTYRAAIAPPSAPPTAPATMPTTTQTTAPVASPATSASRSKKKKRMRPVVKVRPSQAASAPRGPAIVTAKSISELRLWHHRFTHLHPEALQSLIDGFTRGDRCDVCIKAKHKQKFIRTKVKRATTPFELVHSDVCGPFATPTGGSCRNHYFFLFNDD